MEKTYTKSADGLLEITTTKEVVETFSLQDLRTRLEDLQAEKGRAQEQHDREMAGFDQAIALLEADIAKAVELSVPEEPIM